MRVDIQISDITAAKIFPIIYHKITAFSFVAKYIYIFS